MPGTYAVLAYDAVIALAVGIDAVSLFLCLHFPIDLACINISGVDN